MTVILIYVKVEFVDGVYIGAWLHVRTISHVHVHCLSHILYM